MAPTVQTNKVPDRDQRQSRNAEKRTELVCRIKYCNTLPDIPFDPKFIQYPFDAARFISYKPTTLERNYKYEVLTEHDLGVTIDLINKDAYNAEIGATLDPADEKLLEEDVLTPQDSIRSRHHARSVSWLRRTEYISTEQTRFQPQTMDKVEAKVGYSIKKNFKEDPLIMDRESQIRAIEKTFEDSLKPIEKHYSKPNVYPIEILPVFPDFDGWKYPCAQVIFDSDPAPVGRSVPAQLEEMSQAMIRGVMDESGEQFVAYFLPTEETLAKRKADIQNNIDYEDDQEYEYKMAREYNWNVKNKASKGYEENYFLVVREGGMYYNELETRVRLSKRRQKPGQAPSNTRLVIKHRPINEVEYKMQRFREKQLEHPGEEEDEEEPELEPETVTITRTGENGEEGDEGDESDNQSDKDSDKKSNKDDSDKEKDDNLQNKSENEEGNNEGTVENFFLVKYHGVFNFVLLFCLQRRRKRL
ncbi:RNA polymerase-associated protein, putative [Pediculus humanus corporis]|uniref:RNA polymerase II-associated factor 1 homolog n=1 Tax=Pediculus humanus subsp. corporis TaxID=121224 RepID=E0VJB7_PEDHC|nr:RNA polymerase-associated protein, putative [Pediculus humanus corporis]EEB13473.1 RNA polymerase-associated protein, putative [Pediculus humanus corporis]